MINLDSSITTYDLANFRITGKRKRKSFDRPWVTSQGVAAKMANALSRIGGTPQLSGTMTMRESSAVGIQVGTLYEFETRDGEILLLRCTGREEPKPDSRTVTLQFESDRGWANELYFSPDQDDHTAFPLLLAKPASAITILDSPYAFNATPTDTALLYMVARGDTYSTDFDVWRSDTSGGSYASDADRLGGKRFTDFAIKATLTADYGSGTLPIDEYVGIAFQVVAGDETDLETEYSLTDALSHSLLALFGDDTTEIMSIYNLVKTSESHYTALTVRGLYDTRRRALLTGETFWIHKRSTLASDDWPAFSSSARFYKIQPRFVANQVDISTVDPVSHADDARSQWPIAPCNVTANGDRFSAYWEATGADVALAWDNTSRARTVFGLPVNDAPVTDLTGAKIEIRNVDGSTLLDTITVTGTPGAYTLGNAYLVGIVNDSFQVRIYGVRNGWTSLDYSATVVRRH